ncbi:MAG: hypothetical protein ACRERC_16265 [Candidatus Binatia bacterium]
MFAALVGSGIVAGYALALWWLLRREAGWTFAALAALCGLSLALRLVYTGAYPWGFFEDEPKFLGCAIEALQRGTFFGESCIHVPYLFAALFQAPLVPLLGATRWSIRSYAHITSVLATPAAFAAARRMGLRVAPSLAVGGLVAVLPWAIYYGRAILGGELVFHQALLLAGLAGLIWSRGGWRDALLAGFGMCMLLYDYWAGRSMMGLPLVAAVLATGWRRAWCVAVIAIALIGWQPHLATGPLDAHVGLSLRGGAGATVAGGFNPGFDADPLGTLRSRAVMALSVFVWPVAYDSIFTMRSVAMHPPWVLALAVVGLLTGVRRGLFLLAGFVAAIVPGIASGSYGISAHRIMMVYLFIALAAGAALNPLPWRRVRAAAAALLVAAAGVWSVAHYFSDAFWPDDVRWGEHTEMSALAEAVSDAPPAHLIYMHQIGFFGAFASGPATSEPLTSDNWLPVDDTAATYLFTWQAEKLRPEYERMLPGRVRPVGRRSFLVALEAGDHAWLRRHGWVYTARCEDRVRTAQVPFVAHNNMGPPEFGCPGPVVHEWRARWSGPPADMQLHFTGTAEIDAGGVTTRGEGYEQVLPLHLTSGAEVRIRLTVSGPAPTAVLYEVAPGGLRTPAWDGFTPIAADEVAGTAP